MMQMINKNTSTNGITLITLVITIVVLFIILGITLNYGTSEINSVSNKKLESELQIMQEAVMQRYALVKSANQLGVIAPAITSNAKITATSESNRPSGLVGTRIADSQTVLNSGFEEVSLRSNYASGTTDKAFEEFYYLLDESDLQSLGVKKGNSSNDDTSNRSYIVNYLTGEIFDVKNKKYLINGDSIYTQPTTITMDEKKYDYNDD